MRSRPRRARHAADDIPLAQWLHLIGSRVLTTIGDACAYMLALPPQVAGLKRLVARGGTLYGRPRRRR